MVGGVEVGGGGYERPWWVARRQQTPTASRRRSVRVAVSQRCMARAWRETEKELDERNGARDTAINLEGVGGTQQWMARTKVALRLGFSGDELMRARKLLRADAAATRSWVSSSGWLSARAKDASRTG